LSIGITPKGTRVGLEDFVTVVCGFGELMAALGHDSEVNPDGTPVSWDVRSVRKAQDGTLTMTITPSSE